MNKLMMLLVYMLILTFSACGQTEDYSKHPGFVDLSEIASFKESDETVEVFITKPLLSLVASATSEKDPSFYNLIRNLSLIQVNKFSIEKRDTEKLKKIVEKVAKKLTKEKWSKIVRVKEAGERVEIFIKNEGKKIAGLLIMSLEFNKEAVFVNIVGNIDMEQLGKLSRKFNIPKLDSLGVEKGSKKK